MRIISQNGMDFPYESVAISYDDRIISARPISDMEKRYVLAGYSTREKVEKAMQLLHEAYTGSPLIMKNAEVSEDFDEQLKNLRSGFITVIDRGDNVKIEPMNIAFWFPAEDEI